MNGHPYKHLERLPEWKVVDRALSDLTENGDLNEMTARRYIVGHIVKMLLDAKTAGAVTTNGAGGRNRSNGQRRKLPSVAAVRA